MTTALFLLRCNQLGIPLQDLELYSMGMLNEMFIEKANDSANYSELPTQDDFDKF